MIMRTIIAAAITSTFALVPAYAVEQRELTYQQKLCAGMQINRYVQETRTEVDCVSDMHAIEVDFTGKWGQAIGQALAYAAQLEKRPGIILICDSNTSADACLRHGYIVEQAISHFNIGLTLWRCAADAAALGDCQKTEIPQ